MLEILPDLLRSVWRCLVIAILAVGTLPYILMALNQSSGRAARVLWIFVILAMLMPSLLLGYAYSLYSYSLLRYPFWNQALYMLIVFFHLLPLAVIACYFAPRPVSSAGQFCHGLSVQAQPPGRQLASRLGFFLQGPGRPYLAAFSIVFLFSFVEFEIASLMNVHHWTVYLFDAQVQGLPLKDSIVLCLLPIALEVVVIIGLLVCCHGRTTGAEQREKPSATSRLNCLIGWLIGSLTLIVTVMLPVVVIAADAWRGIHLLFQEFWMQKEMVASSLFALVASICTFFLSELLARKILSQRSYRQRCLLSLFFFVPGLLGAMPLSLILLAGFQLPGLVVVRDTPIPQLAGLMLLLLPFAMVLQFLYLEIVPPKSVHAARLAMGGQSAVGKVKAILWKLDLGRKAWAFFMLFCLAYFDLTVASILGPTGMTSVIVRIYNLMHYGQSERLSATVLLVVLVPLGVLLVSRFLLKRVVSGWIYG